MFVDAVGKLCPIPVLMAKKELDGGCADLTVAVDDRTAVENLTRLGESRRLAVTSAQENGRYLVRMTGDAASPAAQPAQGSASCGSETVFFIGKDHIGEGAQELGYNLLKMALYTLSQSDEAPRSLLFMNGGVRLPAGDDAQVLQSLQTLLARGCRVLVCGTCLSYYGLTEALKVGTVSNMYDILDAMTQASKVVAL